MARDLGEWLKRLELARYTSIFARQEISLGDLPELTEADLVEMGLPIGPRRRLLKAIAELSAQASASSATESGDAGRRSATLAEAERRQLTVMFCDLVGSTELSQRLDPEEMRTVILEYQNGVAGEVTRFEGHVAKFMGDGVLAYFGWPEAHEDDAERAVRAGLSIVQSVAAMRVPSGEPLSARVGIATGLVVVGDLVGKGAAQEEAVVGKTPNLAARLQSVAAPGSIVLSEATRSLVGDLFELRELGSLGLKGIGTPVTAYTVESERAFESRFEARSSGKILPMVGRGQELALLRERWRQAKTGEGQMVLLTGEAGIGKSRLTRALVDAVAEGEHLRVGYQCSPYHADSALYPAIQQLGIAARIRPDDAHSTKLDKLEAVLARAGETSNESAALIAALLGVQGEARYGKLELTPLQQRNRTLDALADQLIGLARADPVLFVVEDVHWIDATTLELLDVCLDRIADARVLIVVTARPTFDHTFGGHPIVTRLALNRLGRTQIVGMIDRITAGKPLPAELLEEIVARTDGVPLFVEELTKTVIESDLLTETADAYLVQGSVSQLAIPTTLHDSLMARLDRMRPVKEVAQTAACIGREFHYRLLAAVAPLEEPVLQDVLRRLIEAELVFCRGVPPDARYTFKHALVRDTAYESLLHSKRQQVHRRIAGSLENAFPETVESEPELLAHHYAHAEDFDNAIDYWHKAAERANQRSANRDAVEHLTRGLQALRQLPEDERNVRREAMLQARLGLAYTAVKGQAAPEVEAAYLRARVLSQEVGDDAQLFAVLRGLWLCYQVGSKLDAAREIGEELLALAQAHESSGYAVEAYRALAQTALWSGEFVRARDHFERVITIYDPQAHGQNAYLYGQDPRVLSSCMVATAQWILGCPDQARRRMREGLAYAEELNHSYSRAVAGIMSTFTCALLRDVEQTQIEAERTIRIATDYELPFFLAFGTVYRGRTKVIQGLVEAGMAEIRRGFELYSVRTEAWWSFALIDICLDAGFVNESRDALAEALAAVERSGDHLVEAELYRLSGELLLRAEKAADREAQAEASFHKALDVARGQEARSWELRTAMSLARLWRDQGKRQEAHDLLARIYDGFTEGFETPDLQDARALLEELRHF